MAARCYFLHVKGHHHRIRFIYLYHVAVANQCQSAHLSIIQFSITVEVSAARLYLKHLQQRTLIKVVDFSSSSHNHDQHEKLLHCFQCHDTASLYILLDCTG